MGSGLPQHAGAWPVHDEECRLHSVCPGPGPGLGTEPTPSNDRHHPPKPLILNETCSAGLRQLTPSAYRLALSRPRWQSPKRRCFSSLSRSKATQGRAISAGARRPALPHVFLEDAAWQQPGAKEPGGLTGTHEGREQGAPLCGGGPSAGLRGDTRGLSS